MAGAIQDLYDSNMRHSTDGIHQYSLYGESGQLPDVMHCETIAERSVIYEWELAPHRHDRLHQLLLLSVGSGVARLDEAEFVLPAGSLVNVPRTTVHAFTFEPGTDGWVLTLADAMLDELLAQAPDVRWALGRAWVGVADPDVKEVIAQIGREYAGRSPGRALVLRGLSGALLGRAARIVSRDATGADGRAESQLSQRFTALLEAHYREHWRVADYARALAVTPPHLSRVLRAATGESASRLIDGRVIREARRQLAFTHLGVTSIAYTLGFVDPALFSRVFSRVTGVSPRQFRNQLAAR